MLKTCIIPVARNLNGSLSYFKCCKGYYKSSHGIV